MGEKPFNVVLSDLMDAEGFTPLFLSKRSTVSKETLKNWLSKGRRPRYWQQIVLVADTMELSESAVDVLLTAANHSPLSVLRQLAKPKDRMLLARWQPIELGLIRPPFCIGQADVINDAFTFLSADRSDGDEQPICLLRGMAGVGKTTIAHTIAQQIKSTFDGVLCADLCEDSDARLRTVLMMFADALQIRVDSPSGLPLDLDNLSQRVRSALAKKHILIVLDDVQTRQQIDRLRPEGTRGALLLTTRSRTVRTPFGTQVINVKPFEKSEETLDLFREHLGKERVEQEVDAFTQIAKLIGHLPLAATIIAERLASEDDWSAADFLETELRPEHARLDALAYDDLNVRLSFNVSYQRLPSVRQRQFAQLGVFEGEPFDMSAAATVLTVSKQHTKTILRELHHAALLQKVEDGRYRLHQLLSQYAQDFLSQNDPYVRKITHYLTFAKTHLHDEVTLVKEINNIRFALDGALERQLEQLFVEGVVTTYLFLLDRGLYQSVEAYLNAAVTITNTTTSSTVKAMKGHVFASLAHIYVRTNQPDTANNWVKQAEQFSDDMTQIMIGRVKGELSRHDSADEAIQQWDSALTIARNTNAADHIPALLFNLARQYIQTKQFDAAGQSIAECLAYTEKTPNQRLRGLVLALRGWMSQTQGEYQQADESYQQAYMVALHINHARDLCYLLLSWGYLARLQGNYSAAYKRYNDALARTLPAMNQHIILQSNIGEVLTLQQEYKEARSHFQQGFNLLDEREQSRSYHLLKSLLLHDFGRLELRQKHKEIARSYLEESLTLAKTINYHDRIVQAHLSLGELYRREGKYTVADQAFIDALMLADGIGLAERTLALYGRAQVAHAKGDPNAIKQAQQCYETLSKMGHYHTKSVKVWIRQNSLVEGLKP